MPEDFGWADEETGPFVRPYALTGGRTRPDAALDLDVVSIIETTDAPAAPHLDLGPEHTAILRLCRTPLSVAEVASSLDLPVDVVRVLLSDLHRFGLALVRPPASVSSLPDADLLKEVMNGLRAL
ncbi:MAG: DUF742 domain-containing protein [Streptosporangiaceae bacterium]